MSTHSSHKELSIVKLDENKQAMKKESYLQMVAIALRDLNEPNGSELTSVERFILDKFIVSNGYASWTRLAIGKGIMSGKIKLVFEHTGMCYYDKTSGQLQNCYKKRYQFPRGSRLGMNTNGRRRKKPLRQDSRIGPNLPITDETPRQQFYTAQNMNNETYHSTTFL